MSRQLLPLILGMNNKVGSSKKRNLTCAGVVRTPLPTGDAPPVAIITLCLIACFLTMSCGRTKPPEDERRPNVILVSIDSLRADHVHGYGYGPETTPVLDELMRRGTAFSNCISHAPWTLPVQVSLFTSLYPHSHGVIDKGFALNEDVLTLPVALKNAGYATGGFACLPYHDPDYGFGRGFDTYVCKKMKDFHAPDIFEESLKWLLQLGSSRFFLFLHTYDVHASYNPPEHYLKMFETSYDGHIDGSLTTLLDIRHERIVLSDEDLRHLVALYDAGIREFDHDIGVFLKFLKEKDFLANTIVIVTADHGDEFLEHGGSFHGRTLYDEMLKVPLIMAGPGIPVGKMIEEQVQVIDIMPTILELCGSEIPSGIEGKSLLPLIKQEVADWEQFAFAEADAEKKVKDIYRVVRAGRYKLIYDRLTGREELYDLALDPYEQVNIIEDKPEIAETLRQKLREWMVTERGNPATVKISEKQKNEIRALGYLN